MKRTLNINIGNSLIHIEEDAYEMLTGYLNEIKSHFAKNADDFEIVTDIENRIAEMFAEILSAQHKAAISITDVQQVITQMGTVRDFESSEDEEHPFSMPYSQGIKRLYRDTEKGMVAGVCAGLGHYLNIEERWIRLFALLSTLVGGAGFIAYLVMWIIVPRAQTRSEKMYMKGEAINLQGFIRNFQEEMENSNLLRRSGGIIAEFADWFGRFINGTGKVIFKITAGFIILMSSGMLLAAIVTLASFLGVFDYAGNEIFPLSMVNDSYVSLLLLSAFVVIAVPLLALILFSIRVAFNGRQIHKNVSFGLLILWLAGIATGVFFIAKTSTEFKEHTEITKVSNLKSYPVYTLDLDNSRVFSKEDSLLYHINNENSKGWVILDEREGPFGKPDDVRIYIERSLDATNSVTQNFASHGKTFDAALKNAQSIRYDFQQKDSVLTFGPKLRLTNQAKWRNQEVKLIVRVPVGTHLIINRDLDHYLAGYRSWNCGDSHEGDFVEWIMTENGLKCKNELKEEDHQDQ